jgi:hypothetical protein
LDTDTLTLARRGMRARPLAIGLAALLSLLPTASTLAQEQEDFAFPATLAGEELAVETLRGPDYVQGFRDSGDEAFADGMQALVEGTGASLEDLTVESALYQTEDGDHAVVAGYRIDGVEARRYVRDLVGLVLGDVVDPGLLLRPVAGKWALRVVDESMPGVYPRTVYLRDDVAWVIEGDEQYVQDALYQLPDVAPAASGGDQMIDLVPMQLEGRRRTALYEATEPFFLPTLSERLDTDFETWLVDLYIGSGLTPADVIGLVTWWGIESSQESIQIEGYQLAGADQPHIDQLRDILLATNTELPEGVTRS